MSSLQKNARIPSIDRFRGIVVFSMIIFQFTEHFKQLGAITGISRHAPNEDAIYILPNLSIADIVAPMFILAIGLTYLPSLKRRIEKHGEKNARLHFIKRYLTLVGIGIVMSGINDILDGKSKPLEIVFIVISLVVLLLALACLILKLCKSKLYKSLTKLLSIVVCLAGVFGIATALVNAVMLVSGGTGESYGHWLVLQHIGFAGLVALPFAMLKGKHANTLRFTAAGLILAAFTAFHESSLSSSAFPNNMELIDKVADGGFIGGFAWGAMLIIYIAFSELYYKKRSSYVKALAVFAVIIAGLIAGVFATLPENTQGWAKALSSFLPINKGSVSPSYVLIVSFISLLIFLIFDLFNSFKPKFDLLMWWGKNPILMYCIEFAVIGALNAVFEDYFKTVAAPIAVIIILAVTTALSALVYVLNKKNIVIKL